MVDTTAGAQLLGLRDRLQLAGRIVPRVERQLLSEQGNLGKRRVKRDHEAVRWRASEVVFAAHLAGPAGLLRVVRLLVTRDRLADPRSYANPISSVRAP